MRIGIVIHGPEIVDTGSAKRIIELLGQKHEVIAKLGGTMGRTAVLDAGLEDVIDISKGLKPSEAINELQGSIDLAILLNHGKTIDTGRYFGQIVASRIARSMPFIHIERPDCDGRMIYYDPQAKRCAEYVKDALRGTYELTIEPGKPAPSYVRAEGELVVRKLLGAFPGENIRLEGVVIGVVEKPEPEIVCKDGRILELRGIKAKQHGLEKLENRKLDLYTARVKTGSIRRTLHKPRIKKATCGTKIALIDHCAESTFELVRDAEVVITVGDDTTTIAADILARLGIPIIGIVDGDVDGVLTSSVVPEGSVIIQVKTGFDDMLGAEVLEKLMRGKQQLCMERNELLARILTLAGKYVVDVRYY